MATGQVTFHKDKLVSSFPRFYSNSFQLIPSLHVLLHRFSYSVHRSSASMSLSGKIRSSTASTKPSSKSFLISRPRRRTPSDSHARRMWRRKKNAKRRSSASRRNARRRHGSVITRTMTCFRRTPSQEVATRTERMTGRTISCEDAAGCCHSKQAQLRKCWWCNEHD